MAQTTQDDLQIQNNEPGAIPKPENDEDPVITHLDPSSTQSLCGTEDATVLPFTCKGRREPVEPNGGNGIPIQWRGPRRSKPQEVAPPRLPDVQSMRGMKRDLPMVATGPTVPSVVFCLLGPMFPGALAHPVPFESGDTTESRTLAARSMLDKVFGMLNINLLIQVLLCIVLGAWLVVIRCTRQENAGFWALLTASLTHVFFVHDPKANGVVCLL
ncbi:hypothetical protein CORC01_02155 [Colletotrichum orchidophilum]|uniref:Uncharacterized protein n=1 Tax=Colletotrichum orchidophilum TaxID=1209926 RepID=A0A1G4BLW3_9PEZI|nr:uncharacterized protein CORC01_02155 [Colletotrichum orchidophilum]OHF02460.1 hypothetical protein CORC01_02155 [Colletotrichum orchidophilum]